VNSFFAAKDNNNEMWAKPTNPKNLAKISLVDVEIGLTLIVKNNFFKINKKPQQPGGRNNN